jgi:hypothetical protein
MVAVMSGLRHAQALIDFRLGDETRDLAFSYCWCEAFPQRFA